MPSDRDEPSLGSWGSCLQPRALGLETQTVPRQDVFNPSENPYKWRLAERGGNGGERLAFIASLPKDFL